MSRIIVFCVVGLWVSLTGFVLAGIAMNQLGLMVLHIYMNSITIGLCSSFVLLASYRWKTGTFEVDDKRVVAIILLTSAVSTIAGYKYEWGGYYLIKLHGLFIAFFAFSVLFFTLRAGFLAFGRRPSLPRAWQLFGLLLALTISVLILV